MATAKQEKAQTVSADVREMAQQKMRDSNMMNLRAAQQAVKNAAWGDQVTDQQKAALEHLAEQHGLSIAFGHVIYLGGTPYVTIKGHLAHAMDTGEFDGFIEEGPLPKDEWESWGVREDAQCAWRSVVKRKGVEHPFIEVGWAGGSREQEANKGKGQPVAKAFPGEMARSRARSRALGMAFPLPFKSYEDVAQGGIEIPDEIMQKATQTAPAAPGRDEILRKAGELGFSQPEALELWDDCCSSNIANATREDFDRFITTAQREATAKLELERKAQEVNADAQQQTAASADMFSAG